MNFHESAQSEQAGKRGNEQEDSILPGCHPDQEDRLADLRSFNILDTPREREFDDICSLVSDICNTPVALISLVDEDRQWFKAETGLGRSHTSLSESICAHAILQDDLLEISDTTKDDRTACNPLVARQGGFRFYAGALLVTEDGLPIGTLCTLDYKPRRLTKKQRRALNALAGQVMSQLHLRRALAQQQLMAQEIDHRIKNSLQSITSIVRLQARRVDDPSAREVLRELERRIGSIALLHEELHKTSNSEELRLDCLMKSICGYLQQGVVDTVRVGCQFDPIMIGSRQASAIALMANEFMANSIKHAFPNGRSGRVGFFGISCDTGEFRIVMEDDGVGFDRETISRSGLGLKIIDATIAQLNATIEQDADHDGVRLVITVPAV